MVVHPHHFAGRLLKAFILHAPLFSACLILGACAPRPGGLSQATSGSSMEIDAVLPSNASWTLFRLGGLRYARVGVPAQSATDTGSVGSRIRWMAIPSPEGVFRPVQALPAARGYFHLVDGASSRLCLYDSAFGLISTFALPERFTPFPAGRAAVFRGADGAFLFADYATGEAFLYSDREGVEGASAWRLRARAKMPVGWRDCVQQPGSVEIACRAGGAAMRFDGALNRIPAGGSEAVSTLSPASALKWDPAAREWFVEGFDGAESAPPARPLFRFRPLARSLEWEPGAQP